MSDNNLKDKIKTDIENEAQKYAPDNMEYVWKAIEEAKKPSRLNRLSLIAACLTFCILAAAVTGIVLKTNKGLNTDTSGTLHPGTSAEETVTFAEMYPQLKEFPENRNTYISYKNESSYFVNDEVDFGKLYNYLLSPGTSYHLKDAPENLPEEYWELQLRKDSTDSDYEKFRVYFDGHFAYYAGEDTRPEWFYNKLLFKAENGAKTLAEAYPEIYNTDRSKPDITVKHYNETSAVYVYRNTEKAKTVYDYVFKDGSFACFETTSLNLDRPKAKIIIGTDDIVVAITIHSNGLVNYLIQYADKTKKDSIGFFYNPEGYDFEIFNPEPSGSFLEYHPEFETLPEGYTISFALGDSNEFTAVPEDKAQQVFETLLNPSDALYLNVSSAAQTGSYLTIRLTDPEGELNYTIIYNYNGVFELCEYMEWFINPDATETVLATLFGEDYSEIIPPPDSGEDS